VTAPNGPRARPAATLVVLRDGPEGLEVLLTVRPANFRFMGGAVVFPGGGVEPADLDRRWAAASARPPGDAAAALDEDDESVAQGAFVCALRESFEEVGFLLGIGPIDRLERDFASDATTFLDRCLDHGITLGTDRLVPAGRWVTPLGSDIRFDTRFFCVRSPAGWEPRPHPVELADCAWRAPRAVLSAFARGQIDLAPPTLDVLTRLDRHASVDLALESLARGGLGGSAPATRAHLSPLVRVVLAPNPGPLTGPGTNTYVVGREETVVIDPAVPDDGYVDSVCGLGADIREILVTHRHSDHVGGVARLAARTGAPVRAHSPAEAGGVRVVPLADGDVVTAGGATLTALFTPGHARDHLSFILDQEQALFSGDNVLGEGTSMIAPPDGDMRLYLQSLLRLEELGAKRIYPGHFRPLEGARDVLRRYIAHRKAREQKILDALKSEAMSLEAIVSRAYEDTPAAMRRYAAGSALTHLEKLTQEGRVARRGSLWEGAEGR
jgi:glyoxylase-like metal-dependent hydrolase (beta-lactamase superfamily II)/8-oxo-dGTP pyrophosphatase MutT (NUDIX family)